MHRSPVLADLGLNPPDNRITLGPVRTGVLPRGPGTSGRVPDGHLVPIMPPAGECKVREACGRHIGRVHLHPSHRGHHGTRGIVIGVGSPLGPEKIRRNGRPARVLDEGMTRVRCGESVIGVSNERESC